MSKIKVGIIGTGNIGLDILMKIQRSKYLECGIFTGRSPDSKGIEIAKGMGIKTSFDSIGAIEKNPECCEIVFDATSAKVHEYNAPILKRLNKFAIDLTPSKIGKMCVPALNLEEGLNENNVNLITCGGQASIPIAYAVSKVHPETKYIEIVASIASKSAGAGTRNNVDEFTQTTKDALAEFTGVKNTKAIIILNSAEPPIIMRNTIYAIIDNPDIDSIRKEVMKIVKQIQKYVPGYKIKVEPILENGRVTTTIEVEGLGDYLPKYAGNLDIITCAAIEIAENYAKMKLMKVDINE
jgi:acetaldehyde dehydrogenase (acetylating)